MDELVAAGIAPFPTLYHWDLPQALQDKGGWQSRDTAKAFGDYAGYVAEKLSDRVRHFFTINEFRSFVDMGHHGQGGQCSGRDDDHLNRPRPEARAGRTQSGSAPRGSRSRDGGAGHPGKGQSREPRVGPAENIEIAVPLIETPEHIKAAQTATRERNAPFLTVMLEGKYTDAYLKEAGKDAPKFTDEDLKIIASPLDFVGINVYRPTVYVLASDEAPGWREIPFAKAHPKMSSRGSPSAPRRCTGPRSSCSRSGVRRRSSSPRTAAPTDDVLADDGKVYDTDRIMFLRAYLTQLQRATADGVPVKGYFQWSTMDNFEWTHGFGNRFGLVYVDFKTQKRTPKLSAAWFREAARRNAVV